MSSQEDAEALRERVDELEATVQKMLPGRRAVLAAGAGAAAGAFGMQRASNVGEAADGTAVGQIGTSSEPVNVVAHDVTSDSVGTGTPQTTVVSTNEDIVKLYVDGTNGDDSNDGTSSNPLATIQEAVDRVPTIMRQRYEIEVQNVSGQSFEVRNKHASGYTDTGGTARVAYLRIYSGEAGRAGPVDYGVGLGCTGLNNPLIEDLEADGSNPYQEDGAFAAIACEHSRWDNIKVTGDTGGVVNDSLTIYAGTAELKQDHDYGSGRDKGVNIKRGGTVTCPSANFVGTHSVDPTHGTIHYDPSSLLNCPFPIRPGGRRGVAYAEGRGPEEYLIDDFGDNRESNRIRLHDGDNRQARLVRPDWTTNADAGIKNGTAQLDASGGVIDRPSNLTKGEFYAEAHWIDDPTSGDGPIRWFPMYQDATNYIAIRWDGDGTIALEKSDAGTSTDLISDTGYGGQSYHDVRAGIYSSGEEKLVIDDTLIGTSSDGYRPTASNIRYESFSSSRHQTKRFEVY